MEGVGGGAESERVGGRVGCGCGVWECSIVVSCKNMLLVNEHEEQLEFEMECCVWFYIFE